MRHGAAIATIACVCALAFFGQLGARAATSPYAIVPSVNDKVRFDGSAGGETKAWAYPNQPLLESFLRGTIDASYGATSYDAYQRKMAVVLGNALQYPNGTQAVVQRVQTFSYRGHDDIEVQVRVTSGPFPAMVWTTPAELLSASGRRYLR
jgi:hypothetical protein